MWDIGDGTGYEHHINGAIVGNLFAFIHVELQCHELRKNVNKARVTPSDIQHSAATQIWGCYRLVSRAKGADDEEVSEGGISRVIVYGYDGLPIQPVAAPPLPDYIPGPEDPQTPLVPQDEDEREPMFVHAHDPDFIPEPVYPEYIPLRDEHVFLEKEQPLSPVDSPTAESPGYITESDPKEDPEEYEEDESKDGLADYPIDGGDDRDDEDGDSSGDDADDEDEDEEDEEDEEKEKHLAPVDSDVVVPMDEPVEHVFPTEDSHCLLRSEEAEDGLVDYPMEEGDDGDDDDGDSSGDDADDEDEDEGDEEDEEEEEHLAPADSAIVIPPYEGTEPVIPPSSTDISTIGARITVWLQASISLPPEAEVERLLAMTTPSPSPPISLSPPSAGERLARYTAPPAHSAPPPVPSPLLPSSGFTAALPSPLLPLLPPSLYIPPHADCRDDILDSEQPPCKRLCLSTLGSRYEIRKSSTARPTRGRGIDYGFISTVDAEARRQGISEVGYGDLYALLEDAQDSRQCGIGGGRRLNAPRPLHVMKTVRREIVPMQARVVSTAIAAE
ncbi:hypothetical protein Tco_1183212 [Tanacetum coccineum]